jgi:hypothetical protein
MYKMHVGDKNNKAASKTEEDTYKKYKEDKEDKITKPSNATLFKKYMHDIRNMHTLDEEMINNIRSMSSEEKMDIIISFNVVVENLKAFIDC